MDDGLVNMDVEEPQKDIEVEELSLDDLRTTKEAKAGDAKTRGGLRAGGLGPEGSRYSPPAGRKRSTWKPLVAAFVLFLGGFYGLFTIGYQLTLESQAEGESITLYGRLLDYDEYYDSKDVPLAGVNVSVDGMGLVTRTDDDGKFTYPDIPGGKFTIRFFKRSWEQAVNTTYVSILYTEVDKGSPAVFLAKTTDLAPDRGPPTYDGPLGVLAEVVDWTDDNTVSLWVHASSFDTDLSQCHLQASPGGGTYTGWANYTNIYHFEFPTEADQSHLSVQLVYPGNRTPLTTSIEIPDHPLGVDGWKATTFPDASLFVHGGLHTNGNGRTILVSSQGATQFATRAEGGEWSDWEDMSDGSGEFIYVPTGDEGTRVLEVMCRNDTGVNGTTAQVSILYETTPPTIEPTFTRGPAVTDEATFSAPSEGGAFLRYGLPDGTWSAWQLQTSELLVPIDDSGDSYTVTFQVMDLAGNVAEGTATVTVLHQKEQLIDDHARFYSNLMVCIPVQLLGVILAFLGGWSAWKRRSPNMVILGAIGALLAGYGIVGALVAAIALVFVMFSREEFETPAPPPPPEG